jgi:hypothetical protein
MAPRGLGLGIDWNFPVHHGLIDERGETLIHETGLRCTCGNDDTMAGEIERTHVPRKRTTFRCNICGGLGFIYRNPRKIIAIVTGISEDYSRDEAGWLNPGDAVMSPHPGYTITAGDRITFTWPQPVPDGQVIVRGAGTFSDNSTRKTEIGDNEDRLWYHAKESIWCEDQDGKVYQPGDFELDGSKVIRWVGNSPTPNKIYTIKYEAYLEWKVFTPSGARRDRDRDLGDRVYLRKSHLVNPNDNPQISTEDRVRFCARLGC